MKRILSVLLCLCMVMTLIPAVAMAASDVVYVGGYAMGDGTATTYYKNGGTVGSESDYSAKLEKVGEVLTLTLNNFEYYGASRGVDSSAKLRIVLEGTNNITSTGDYGIYSNKDLEIVGADGSTLDVTSTNENAIMAYDVYMGYNESITITDANIVATAGDVGIVASKALSITGSVINTTGKNHGLQGGGFAPNEPTSITVTDSTITAIATSNNGIAFKSAPVVSEDYQWRSAVDGEWTAYVNTDDDFTAAKYVEFKPGSPAANPPSYEEYAILSDELTDVQTALDGIADVTKDAGTGVVTIKLTGDVYGRIRFDGNNGEFILDLNGKTITPGDRNEALCLDNYFGGVVTVTGDGTIKKGANNIVYNWDGTLNFAVAADKDYFSLKNGEDNVFDEKNTTTKEFTGTFTWSGESFVVIQGIFQTYTVLFDSNGHGVAPDAINNVIEGNKISAPTEPAAEGYTFGGWYKEASCENEWDFDNDTVTGDITLYALWEEVNNNSNRHYGGLQAGGDMSTDGKDKLGSEYKDEDEPEAEIKPVVKPDDGVCDGTSADNCLAVRFSDLNTGAWYHADVDYAISKGLFNGTTATAFSPNGRLTRAMLVAVLYRAEGSPATNKSIPFADVDMGSYYANAVSWAQQNRIVTGVSDTKFAPDENITREQIATILYRYAVYKERNVDVNDENLKFADASSVSDYALAAMTWNIKNGFVQGRSGNMLAPREFATRAEAAALLHRFLEAK